MSDILLSAERPSDYREKIDAIVMDVLGVDKDPTPITKRILGLSNQGDNGHASTQMDKSAMALAIYHTSRSMTQARFSDKPDSNNRIEQGKDTMAVLAEISGNRSIADISHVATLEEAEAVVDSPESNANTTLNAKRQEMGRETLYSGTIDEISLSMANDFGGDHLEARDKARVPNQIKGFLNDHFSNPSNGQTVKVTKQDLSAITDSMAEYGSRAMEKPVFAHVARSIEELAKPNVLRPQASRLTL